MSSPVKRTLTDKKGKPRTEPCGPRRCRRQKTRGTSHWGRSNKEWLTMPSVSKQISLNIWILTWGLGNDPSILAGALRIPTPRVPWTPPRHEEKAQDVKPLQLFFPTASPWPAAPAASEAPHGSLTAGFLSPLTLHNSPTAVLREHTTAGINFFGHVHNRDLLKSWIHSANLANRIPL